MRSLELVLTATIAVTSGAAADGGANFPHPSGWHTASDIARVRAFIASGREPWHTATQLLLNDTSLKSDYIPEPAAIVCRTISSVPCCPPNQTTPCNASGSGGMERDGMASLYLMYRWIATNSSVWADAAQRVLDAWSGVLVGFAGHDQMLAIGLYGGHFAQAAELLSYAKRGSLWPLKVRAQRMFLEVIHPGCDSFCGRSSTGWPMPAPQNCVHSANGNWDAVCMSGVASWAVFLDNATMLNTVATYFRKGAGNGRLVNYIIDPQGECQESGRDQGHTQLGIFNLVQAAFTIFHATNSTEIFTMEHSRLRAGIEYSTAYNLGYHVNYTSNCGDTPGSLPKPKGAGWCFKTGPSNQSRGEFAPFYELVGGIYGDAVPRVQELLRSHAHGPGGVSYRPESGRGGPIIHGGAHVGDGAPRFGTLMHLGMSPII